MNTLYHSLFKNTWSITLSQELNQQPCGHKFHQFMVPDQSAPFPQLHLLPLRAAARVYTKSLQSSPTLLSYGLQRARLFCTWDSLPQGIFPDLGTESMSLAPPAFAGGLFTSSSTWEAPCTAGGEPNEHISLPSPHAATLCSQLKINHGGNLKVADLQNYKYIVLVFYREKQQFG